MENTQITLEDQIRQTIDEVIELSANLENCKISDDKLQKLINITCSKLTIIKHVSSTCQFELEYTDVEQNILNNLKNISPLLTNAQQYITGENTNIPQAIRELERAKDPIQSSLMAMYTMPIIGSNVNSKSDIQKHIALYKRNLTVMAKTVNEEKDKILLEQGELEKTLATLRNDTSNFKNDLLEDIETIKESNEKHKKVFADNFSELQEQASRNFDKLEKETTKKFKDLELSIQQKDAKISELIGLIGEKANIGEYKKNADDAHRERVRWQILTVSIFLVAFLLMGAITLFSPQHDLVTIAKYIVSIILLGASGYTAKQAGNSRKDEVYYRKQQLELATIDIYLENMPDNEKWKIKKELSTKLFGQASATYKNKYKDSSKLGLEDIISLSKNIIPDKGQK